MFRLGPFVVVVLVVGVVVFDCGVDVGGDGDCHPVGGVDGFRCEAVEWVGGCLVSVDEPCDGFDDGDFDD